MLLGGTPQEAADQMRQAFPDPVQNARLWQDAQVVASSTVVAIIAAGFLVIPLPTRRLPNHGRITHTQGVAGFTDTNLARLVRIFQDSPTPP